jgi:hypothetical protein
MGDPASCSNWSGSSEPNRTSHGSPTNEPSTSRMRRLIFSDVLASRGKIGNATASLLRSAAKTFVRFSTRRVSASTR